jgi:hypothetical protein
MQNSPQNNAYSLNLDDRLFLINMSHATPPHPHANVLSQSFSIQESSGGAQKVPQKRNLSRPQNEGKKRKFNLSSEPSLTIELESEAALSIIISFYRMFVTELKNKFPDVIGIRCNEENGNFIIYYSKNLESQLILRYFNDFIEKFDANKYLLEDNVRAEPTVELRFNDFSSIEKIMIHDEIEKTREFIGQNSYAGVLMKITDDEMYMEFEGEDKENAIKSYKEFLGGSILAICTEKLSLEDIDEALVEGIIQKKQFKNHFCENIQNYSRNIVQITSIDSEKVKFEYTELQTKPEDEILDEIKTAIETYFENTYDSVTVRPHILEDIHLSAQVAIFMKRELTELLLKLYDINEDEIFFLNCMPENKCKQKPKPIVSFYTEAYDLNLCAFKTANISERLNRIHYLKIELEPNILQTLATTRTWTTVYNAFDTFCNDSKDGMFIENDFEKNLILAAAGLIDAAYMFAITKYIISSIKSKRLNCSDAMYKECEPVLRQELNKLECHVGMLNNEMIIYSANAVNLSNGKIFVEDLIKNYISKTLRLHQSIPNFIYREISKILKKFQFIRIDFLPGQSDLINIGGRKSEIELFERWIKDNIGIMIYKGINNTILLSEFKYGSTDLVSYEKNITLCGELTNLKLLTYQMEL